MLESAKIQSRQSEIRAEVAALTAKPEPSADELRSMDKLSSEYQANETRYRAALIAEDTERREAGAEFETREGAEWDKLLGGFELRQAVLSLDEGRALDGATAEVVQELRSQGGFRGIPIPYEALEQRAGETVSSGIPDPMQTMPIIDRLFPGSVAGAVGARLINIAAGSQEYPVTTSSVSAGWAGSETGNVAGPTAYTASGNSLSPDQTLGVQLKITRKALKQTAGIEQAIRRDLQGAIAAELDKAIFQGSGASGQPSGVIAKASGYGITEHDAASATAAYSVFAEAVAAFITANAATGPGDVRVLARPEIWSYMDSTMFDTGSGITEYDKLVSKLASVTLSHNALAAPATDLSKVLLTTTAGGVAPIFVGVWGAVDLIKDPYSDAQSGGLRLTGLVTADVTVSRAAQLRILKNVKSA